MKTKCVVGLFLLMCVVSMMSGENISPLRVVYQDATNIKLKLVTPALEMESVKSGEYQSLRLAGSAPTADVGYPELPMYSTLVAIPAKGDFSIRVIEGSYQTKSNIKPIPVFSNEKEEEECSYNAAAYAKTQMYPEKSFANSNAQIIRDFRVVQLNLFPVRYKANTKDLQICSEMTVEISMKDTPGDNELPEYTGYSAAFTNLYESMISNFSNYRDALMAPANPRILLIYGGNSTEQAFLNKLNEFVTWKRQKGYEVNVINTATIGSTSNTGIKNYIQTQYNNVATRPDYIILMGDTNGTYPIPAFIENMSSYSGEGDYPYTHLAGSDLLGDVFIGRISASNFSELDVILNKGFAIEKSINTVGTGAGWLNRMLLIGDPSSSGISTRYVNKFIRELALDHNPDYTFIENYSSGFATTMNNGINQGVGFFNYRGYIGMSSWSPGSSLINGARMPHATILTCATGSYSGGTSTTEEIIRLGTSAVPAGSVTAIGMATSGTHTMFNNSLNAGLYEGIFSYNMRTMGEALLNARLYIKQIYGSTHDNQANYFSHWCNLMGDPTVEVFTSIPDVLTIIAPETMPMGTTVLDLQVMDQLGNPAVNVCVTAYSAPLNSIIAKGFTDDEGDVSLNLSGGLQNLITLTASAHNYKPHQVTVNVDNVGSIVYANKMIIDDGSYGSIGNGDSFATAGETVAIKLEVRNTTALSIGTSTAVLTCNDPYISIVSNQIELAAIEPNQSVFGELPFVVSIASNLPPNHDVRFQVDVSDELDQQYSFLFHIATYNAKLQVNNLSVSAGGNDVLDPTESGDLQLWIKNNSICPVYDVSAELISLNDLVSISNRYAYIGAISAGMVGVTVSPFEVLARAQLIPGMQIPMQVRLYNSDGFEQIASFNLPIGQVSSTTPLGPDSYGYFIYDSTDTMYPDCPSYEWVEITPALGGSGTLLTGFNDSGDSYDEGDQNGAVTLKVLDLPFLFKFYGETYTQITVCVNGFIAMGVTENGEFRNYHLPGGYGASPMIAAFWDDLILIQDAGIYQYYNENDHTYVIQYNKMRNGYNRTSLETFQVIFYDPQYYPTSLGDGKIKIQYKDFNNVDIGASGGYTPRHGNYSSIGIKDHTNTRGLEYSYNNTYPPAAAPLSNNKALLITTVPVLHQNPFVKIHELIISDPNGNGIAEPGETVELGIKLVNLGINTAESVQLNASTNNSFASISNANCAYPNIAGDQLVVNPLPILLHISEDCPDQLMIPIVCDITINGDSWQYTLNVMVRKPSITVSGIYMNDGLSNGNGLIEPGEAINLIVNITNESSLDAKNIICNLSSQSPWASISNPSVALTDVPIGRVYQAVFNVEFSPEAISGSNIPFSISYEGDMISPQNQELFVGIGTSGVNENFETTNGSFVATPANNGWEWGTSTQGSHSGSKVWGTLLNSQYPSNSTFTLVTPSVYIGQNSFLEFWHKYDAEPTYDGGQVQISTNNGGSWNLINPEGGYPYASVAALNGPGYNGTSGEWVQARFSLSEYANQNATFRFIFKSDNMIEGEGWFIDDVTTSGATEFVGKLSGVLSSSHEEIVMGNVSIENVHKWGVHPDVDGSYELYLPMGIHNVTASSPGYLSNTVSNLGFTAVNHNLQQNFFLGYFQPTAAPSYSTHESVLTLTWPIPNDPEFVLTGYDVYKKLNTDRFELVANVLTNSYSETLNVFGDYAYHIVCNYAQGNSLPSENCEFSYTSDGEDEIITQPAINKLIGNYPNPFNPNTSFRFSIKENAPVKLSIYNVKGQLVTTLVDRQLTAGMHQIVWNGKDMNNRPVSSGLYLYRLETRNYTETKRAILMK